MNEQRILDEIRTAAENRGAPLGIDRFAVATGITEATWRGRFWARWNDAVREAVLTPNTRKPRTDADVLFAQLAAFIHELGHYPTVGEMRLRKREDDASPNHRVFDRRYSKRELLQHAVGFCERGWLVRRRSNLSAVGRQLRKWG